jgi:sugar phosphate isomerase/epimerase
MHLGCCAYSYRDALKAGQITLSDFLHKCVEMNLDGVELTAYYFADTSKETLHAVKREAYRLGLDVCGTAVGNAFTSPDETERRKNVQMVKEWIEHSVTLGAPGIRVFAGPLTNGVSEDDAFRWTVECLKECADYGGQHGIMVALENHGGITSTAAQTLRLIETVNHDWLGVNLDLGNYHTNPYEEIAQTVPFAVTAHAKISGYTTSHLDYYKVIETLNRAAYRGYLNIEYEDQEDPETAVPRIVGELHQALRDVSQPK